MAIDSVQPIAHGNYANGTIVMESKLACRRAQDAAKPVIDEVFAAWSQICGREMACVHTYGMEDAERAIVIVTHNMEQASRVSNRTAFFYMGNMVEYDETDEIFQRPKDKRLNDYLTGMFS